MHTQTEIKPIGFTLTQDAADATAARFTAADLNRAIGRMLKAERQKRGMSQKDVAEQLDVAYQQVQKYETGHNALSMFKLLQATSLFGVSVLDVLTQAAAAIVMPEEDETEAEVYAAIRYLRMTTPHELKGVMAMLRSLTHGRGKPEQDARRAA